MRDLRIESLLGTSLDTEVTYDGAPVRCISRLELDVQVPDVWRAKLHVELFQVLVQVQEGNFTGTLDSRTKEEIQTLPKEVIRDIANELLEMSHPPERPPITEWVG